MSNKLHELCQVAQSKRNAGWEEELFKAFLSSDKLWVENQRSFQGPDNFSYFEVRSEESEGAKGLSVEDVLGWCTEQGLGLVLNLKEEATPDYVFPYGMVWNAYAYNQFVNSEVGEPDEETDVINIHEITESYLPGHVREILSGFFETNEIPAPTVSLISAGPLEEGKVPPYELLLFFPGLEELPEEDKDSLLEAVSWFLPMDYNLAWVVEENKDLAFQPLQVESPSE